MKTWAGNDMVERTIDWDRSCVTITFRDIDPELFALITGQTSRAFDELLQETQLRDSGFRGPSITHAWVDEAFIADQEAGDGAYHADAQTFHVGDPLGSVIH